MGEGECLRSSGTPFVSERSSWFVRLRSSCQLQVKCGIWTFCSCGKMRRMANSVKDDVVNVLCIKIGTKRSSCYTGSGKDLLIVLPTGFGKSSILQVLVPWSKRNYDKETFERSCRLSTTTGCSWSNGISIFDRINGSYAHGFSFGGHKVRQISTRICVSGEHFGKAIFFAHERHNNTVLPEYAGLCQTNYGA